MNNGIETDYQLGQAIILKMTALKKQKIHSHLIVTMPKIISIVLGN